MTELEAYRNTFAAIQGLRAFRHGEPKEVALVDGDLRARRMLAKVNFGYWSKSSISSGTEIVFLILQDALPGDAIISADSVQFGNELWKITGWKTPTETQKPYWLLSVEFEEMRDG